MSSDQALPDKGPPPGVKNAPPAVEASLVAPDGPPVALDPSKLTPEEQMARFAKELKENDWGHQPC
jgi:hypothetical protein